MPDPTSPAARFAAVYLALKVGHGIGDLWVQTDRQAKHKGKPDAAGRAACAGHVATLTMTKAVTLAVTARALGLRLRPGPTAFALLADAASHYWIDRRFTLRGLAARLGRLGFFDRGDPAAAPTGTGRYAMDQAAHDVCLLAAALIIAVGRRDR